MGLTKAPSTHRRLRSRRFQPLPRRLFHLFVRTGANKKAVPINQRAIDESAALGSPLLVLVCGGIAPAGLDRSREMVLEGIAGLTPYAQARGVKLGIEPLHPMFTADRSVIATWNKQTL